MKKTKRVKKAEKVVEKVSGNVVREEEEVLTADLHSAYASTDVKVAMRGDKAEIVVFRANQRIRLLCDKDGIHIGSLLDEGQ